MTYTPPSIMADEHEVPTQLGERIPLIPLLFPFDWTQRQVYWMAICFSLGANQISDAHALSAWLVVLAYMAAGTVGVVIEYMVRPSPEFWLSAWLEYFAVLLLSLPLWWRRLIPGNASMGWPLAVLPLWLGRRIVAPGEVLNDGVIRLPGRLGRPASFAVVIGIMPRPHPDLLPMILRQTLIQVRLNIFHRIRGTWSLHLQVRPFDLDTLEVGSGPAWAWVRQFLAPSMVTRRPALVLYGADSSELLQHANAILDRFRQASMPAWRQTAGEVRKLAAELWSDVGLTTSDRVRVGMRRVIAGRIAYRSWALIELPRIIHLTWLRPLVSESLLCDIAIHVNVRRPAPARRALQRAVRQWSAVDQDEDYEIAVADARRTVNAMRRGQDMAATIGMYVTAREEQAEKVAEALETSQCEFRAADMMQHRALRATRTLGGDPFNRTMQADLRTAATTDLLATAGYWPAGATLIGHALSAPEPIGINLFDDEHNLNWSMFIAIMQGGGKTTTAHTLAWRMANPHPRHVLAGTGVQIVSVDFKASGDYESLYRNLSDRGQKASYNAWAGGALPSIDGHMGFNLSDVLEDRRGARLLELTQRIEDWAAAHKTDDRPMLLLVDEVLAILEAPGGASFLRRFGTQSRSSNIGAVFMSQDIESLVADHKAALAFKNCSHVLVGRQNPAGLKATARELTLDDDAQVLLASAPQGSGLLRIERKDGPVVLGIQVRPTDWELREFGTNPAERARRWRQANVKDHNVPTPSRKEAVHSNGHAGSALADLVTVAGLEAI